MAVPSAFVPKELMAGTTLRLNSLAGIKRLIAVRGSTKSERYVWTHLIDSL
jgi:hypothetical protein